MPPAVEPVQGVHVDALLSNLARLYRPTEFIADQVVPYIGVVHESDLYPVFTQGDFYGTDVDDLVGDRAEPRIVDVSHGTARYQTDRRELAWDISDRERKNADDQFRLEQNKQLAVQGRLSLKRDIRADALLKKTTNGGQLTNGANAAAKWDAAATTVESIQGDVFTARETMRQSIGVRPNVIVIPEAVVAGLHKVTAIKSLLQYTYGSPSERPLFTDYYPVLPAILWGLRVITNGTIKNTAGENLAESYSDVWGESVRVLFVQPGPALENPSAAYTFRSEEMSTRRDRRERNRTDWFAVGQTIVETVVAPLAGYEIADCLT